MTARPAALRAVVVGAGVSGLAAAHRLCELARDHGVPLDLVVLESTARAGGLVRTVRRRELVLEAGPDQFVTHKPAALALCRRLGLEIETLAPSRPSTSIVRGGRLVPLPRGTVLFAPTRAGALLRSPLLSPAGRLRVLLEPLVPCRPADAPDETLAAFVRRRLGREVVERIADPVAAGIFAGRADQLGATATAGPFVRIERSNRSLLRALRGHAGRSTAAAFAVLREGTERLIDVLVAQLPPGALRLTTPARALRRGATGWTVELGGGASLSADLALVACPATEAARLLGSSWPAPAPKMASCASVHLAYPRAALDRPLIGHGFFVPRAERSPLLACSFSSEKVPGRAPMDRILMRAFVGGARQPELLERGDDELVVLADRTLRPLLGLRAAPGAAEVFRCAAAMPQYPPGYLDEVARARSALLPRDGLAVIGSLVGAFGVPDAVASGEGAAEALFTEALSRIDQPRAAAG